MILEYISPLSNTFRPTSIEQYTVLQIFLDFNDHPFNIRKYMIAAEWHNAAVLIEAHRLVRKAKGSAADFFVELEKH
jgi:hypothetical protein